LNYLIGSHQKPQFGQANNKIIKTRIGIENIYDPWYYVNTGGTYLKKPIQMEFQFDQWNSTYLKELIANESYYRWLNSNSSSFLGRFTNNFSQSICCGIESAVNPNKVAPSDVVESYIDYLFWNETYTGQCDKLYNITDVWNGLYDGFKLDFEHLIKYNVTENSIQTC